MKHISILILFILLFAASCSVKTGDEINLAGEWMVKLDPDNSGINAEWAKSEMEGATIYLPGTLDDAEIGEKSTLEPAINNEVLSNLNRKYQYIGAAWYQKEISIPKSWSGKKICLKMERIIWESRVFVDGKEVGKSESLITPHRYELSEVLTPGKHTLTILIDNSNKYPYINVKAEKYPDERNQEMAHAYTNHTQIKWNGILGEFKLIAKEKNRIENVQVYSDVKNDKIKITLDNLLTSAGVLKYEIVSKEGEKIAEHELKGDETSFVVDKPLGIKTWDEFNPNLYDLNLIYSHDGLADTVSTTFGYSQISHDGSILTLNGQRIFLRGNLECAIFPLTGHPPTEKEEWLTLLKQAKDYGLNHFRFHSYCPPKAAFEAADELGFYFQVELPHWSLQFGKDQKTTDYLQNEADLLLKEYGNHPSFIMMALGNELQGDIDLMNVMVANLKSKDNRHLYMTTCYSFQKPLGLVAQPEDDFFVTQKTDKGWIRGQGIFNVEKPSFNEDYTATSEHVPVPLISHEIGQYSVYPDIKEIEKYTGVLKPLNFMAVKNELDKKGLITKAEHFKMASGKFAALLYKEEIERALKTPAFDGFQLLQLQDFPGQGTALVGLLNAFWESKGIITAEEFRKFNSEVVPLIRYKKAVYENGEVFKASIEVANFYKDLPKQTITWKIRGKEGVVAQGQLNGVDLSIGNNMNLGEIVLPVKVSNAEKQTITIAIDGTNYENRWSIWAYPKSKTYQSNRVFITKSLDQAQKALAQGKKVLYNPPYKKLNGVEGRFLPVFWSPVHFPNQPNTMGLLVDEKHPALQHFPTSFHSDWQWWDLCVQSKSINCDSLNVDPIVRVVDNFVTNRKLATVFEAKAGKGKLIVSAMDLTNDLDNRPVARQLRYSLMKYMESNQFNPSKEIDLENANLIQNEAGKKFNDLDIYDE